MFLVLALVGAGVFALLLVIGGGVWYLWSTRFREPSEVAQNSGGFQPPVIPQPSIPRSVIPDPSIPIPEPPQQVFPQPGIPQQAVPQPAIPQPSVPVQPQTPIGPAIAGAERRIKYQWNLGDTHTYQFSVNAGEGNDSVQVTGSCTYTVGSDVQAANPDEEEGTGTGFVVSPNGYLATCAHVVEGAKRIEVVLGEKTYSATVVSLDARADVALLRIEADGLTVPPWMNSDQVQLAESVRAIGFPLSDVLGTDVKITTGTVAGIVQDPDHGRRIQVDAAINPGNSGGPLVNEAGQIVGIASAKLAGNSVTAVGFAAPINELARLMADRQIQTPYAQPSGALTGPEIARRVTPSVAYIRVWGSSGGRLVSLNYHTNFSEMRRVNPGRIGFGAFPALPSHTTDQGTIRVNSLGEVFEYSGDVHLPFVLGPAGLFFLERLDAHSETSWQHEEETSLRRVKEQDNGPFGPGIPRSPFGPRGGFGPGFPPGFGPPGFGPPGFGGARQQEETIDVIPATERTTYKSAQELNGRISLTKSYEFTTTVNPERPHLKIRGTGTVVFDTKRGMPQSLEYQATVEVNEDGEHDRFPLTVTYTLRDPEELKREQEAARQLAEEMKQQREREATVPSPELVDQLLTEIRNAEGDGRAATPFTKLSEIAVVEEKRPEVLKVARNHLQNSNGFVRKTAAEAIARWASKDDFDDLVAIIQNTDSLLFTAQQKAVKTLASFGEPRAYPVIIQGLKHSFVRNDAKEALISIGSDVETVLLENLKSQSEDQIRRDLMEVLQKTGTEKSIAPLEEIAKGPNFSLKHTAERALDAIRSRL
ncbi:MAG: trypsin-like peptidase domain-containing protein [Planctomyces sp.]|nr:trypsin-like peptidase domain-containing protein [Planctomyces sp.]